MNHVETFAEFCEFNVLDIDSACARLLYARFVLSLLDRLAS